MPTDVLTEKFKTIKQSVLKTFSETGGKISGATPNLTFAKIADKMGKAIVKEEEIGLGFKREIDKHLEQIEELKGKIKEKEGFVEDMSRSYVIAKEMIDIEEISTEDIGSKPEPKAEEKIKEVPQKKTVKAKEQTTSLIPEEEATPTEPKKETITPEPKKEIVEPEPKVEAKTPSAETLEIKSEGLGENDDLMDGMVDDIDDGLGMN